MKVIIETKNWQLAKRIEKNQYTILGIFLAFIFPLVILHLIVPFWYWNQCINPATWFLLALAFLVFIGGIFVGMNGKAIKGCD